MSSMGTADSCSLETRAPGAGRGQSQKLSIAAAVVAVVAEDSTAGAAGREARAGRDRR